nr:xanthine dehydrogenase accessory protein XdhC [Rugamonas sp. CCM 8940]
MVTVAKGEGSVPREAGTKMLVTAHGQCDTIGGGHLEMRALEIARAMLHRGAPRLERFPLGPSLGQCCGGVVHLLFERVDGALAEVLAGLRGHADQDCLRISAIDGTAVAALFDRDGAALAGAPAQRAEAGAALAVLLPPASTGRGAAGSTPAHAAVAPSRPAMPTAALILAEPQGRRWLLDPCLAPRAQLLLFGAGHVGAALVRALAELPCRVSWIDERDAMFPADLPANVVAEASDTPEALVAAAPPGASYLVMTHSHALDQRLSEAILARAEVGWFGLIGSHTKRMQFEHRLRQRGYAAERIAAMVCPIGLAGIRNKAPAVIAASVCAQLMTVWEAQFAATALPPQPTSPPSSH